MPKTETNVYSELADGLPFASVFPLLGFTNWVLTGPPDTVFAVLMIGLSVSMIGLFYVAETTRTGK